MLDRQNERNKAERIEEGRVRIYDDWIGQKDIKEIINEGRNWMKEGNKIQSRERMHKRKIEHNRTID